MIGAGILIFGLVGIWIADNLSVDFSRPGEAGTIGNFIGATALGMLAFKGFTTITNSGSEVKDPTRNIGRAIVISIAAFVVIYTLVGFAVASNLTLAEIIETRDYSLAAAALPALGEYGVWFTVTIAIYRGVIRYLREDIQARAWVPATAIFLDLLALGGFVWVKLNSDPFVIGVAVTAMVFIAVGEQLFLKKSEATRQADQRESGAHDH